MARSPSRSRPSKQISVNDLARYMISTDTARMGIIHRARERSVPPLIRYRDVRPVLCLFLADDGRPVNPLVEAEQMFEQRADDLLCRPFVKTTLGSR